MKIINLTPHSLNFYSNSNLVLTIPSSGIVRATEQKENIGEIDLDGLTIPIFHIRYGKPEGLPEKIDEDAIYVVSAIAAQAIKQHCPELSHKFYVVAETVRDSKGQIIGCKALANL